MLECLKWVALRKQLKQECIPGRCVTTAAVAVAVAFPLWMATPQKEPSTRQEIISYPLVRNIVPDRK